MHRRIGFIYTETTGLHQTNESVSKKNLFCFARMVTLNYEIGYLNDKQFIQEEEVRLIIKPRCMVIPEDTVKYHGITQDYAIKNGIDPEDAINKFKNDFKDVDIIVSHNIDFHLRTIIAEAVKYNIPLEFTNYLIIDTISFYHEYGYVKLKDLATKLSIKNIDDKTNLELIRSTFFKLYMKYQKSILKTS